MIKCILVDDNKMARIALKQLISQVDGLVFEAECESAMEAYNILQKEEIDLIFLDIEMPGMTGLELAKQLTDKRALILFTTAKTEYAIDAFELNVVDYLMKPVVIGRLLLAIEKVKEIMDSRASIKTTESLDFFFVKDKSTLKKIMIADILFFEASGDYVKVHTSDKAYMVHTTLKAIEQKFNATLFIRTHRSYIIALNKIDNIEDGVVSIQKHKIPVADAYRSGLNQRIKFL